MKYVRGGYIILAIHMYFAYISRKFFPNFDVKISLQCNFLFSLLSICPRWKTWLIFSNDNSLYQSFCWKEVQNVQNPTRHLVKWCVKILAITCTMYNTVDNYPALLITSILISFHKITHVKIH